MTDAPGQFMLPVDESPPKERLSRPMLLAVGAAAVLIHLALLTVFTPLKPEPAGDSLPRADSRAPTGLRCTFPPSLRIPTRTF